MGIFGSSEMGDKMGGLAAYFYPVSQVIVVRLHLKRPFNVREFVPS